MQNQLSHFVQVYLEEAQTLFQPYMLKDWCYMKNWIYKHPNLSAWFVLAIGMVAILLFTARDVGLEGMQWFWLIIITVLVAGACIWIISWGDEEEGHESAG
jgi:hypothetical protein